MGEKEKKMFNSSTEHGDQHRSSGSLRKAVILGVIAGLAVGIPATALSKEAIRHFPTFNGTDIINGSLTGKDIKDGSLTGKDLKNNAVTGGKVKNDSLTGADINEGSLGQVPSAANAGHAGSADSATNATNATNAINATNATNAVTAQTLTAAESFRNIGTAGNPAFQNAWTNFGGGRATAGFFKDQQNIVYLKGSITGGSNGTTAFTLPAGYRPAATLLLPVASGSGLIVTATLDSSGGLSPFCSGGCSGSIGLDGLSFRVGSGGAGPSAGPTGDTPDG
jgi:hypothetical protein